MGAVRQGSTATRLSALTYTERISFYLVNVLVLLHWHHSKTLVTFEELYFTHLARFFRKNNADNVRRLCTITHYSYRCYFLYYAENETNGRREPLSAPLSAGKDESDTKNIWPRSMIIPGKASIRK